MRMTLDLLHEFANTEVFCLFHNCMWHSRHPEVDVYFLALCQQIDGLFTFNGSHPFLHDLRLCLDLNVQHTLGRNWKQVSLFLHWCFRSQVRHVCRFPEHSNRMVALPKQLSLFLQLDFWFLVGFVGSLHFLQQFLNQFFHPIVFKGNLRRRPR